MPVARRVDGRGRGAGERRRRRASRRAVVGAPAGSGAVGGAAVGNRAGDDRARFGAAPAPHRDRRRAPPGACARLRAARGSRDRRSPRSVRRRTRTTTRRSRRDAAARPRRSAPDDAGCGRGSARRGSLAAPITGRAVASARTAGRPCRRARRRHDRLVQVARCRIAAPPGGLRRPGGCRRTAGRRRRAHRRRRRPDGIGSPGRRQGRHRATAARRSRRGSARGVGSRRRVGVRARVRGARRPAMARAMPDRPRGGFFGARLGLDGRGGVLGDARRRRRLGVERQLAFGIEGAARLQRAPAARGSRRRSVAERDQLRGAASATATIAPWTSSSCWTNSGAWAWRSVFQPDPAASSSSGR